MRTEFDPYHKWLGIPKNRRPPSHYDLLGISLDEVDTDVIRSAAEQRKRFVATQMGKGRDNAVGEILYRLDEALATLLSPEMRRDYDRRLNLFHKRKKKRQVDPHFVRNPLQSGSSKSVGEESGLAKEFTAIVITLTLAFIAMAVVSFNLPWNRLSVSEKVAGVPAIPVLVKPKAEPQPVPAQVNPAEPPPNPVIEEPPSPLPPNRTEEMNSTPPTPAEPQATPAEPQGPQTMENINTPAISEDGFQALFDGRSLRGWKSYSGGPPGKGWAVINGSLFLVGGEGGDLITEEQFEDFELEFEWKSKGNSGVMYRVRMGDAKPSDNAPEYQIYGNDSGSLWGLVPVKQQLKPDGTFNQSRIIVRGNHIQHWLNGKKVVDIRIGNQAWNQAMAKSPLAKRKDFAKARRGHICLQDIGDDIFFRNIRIKSLSNQN